MILDVYYFDEDLYRRDLSLYKRGLTNTVIHPTDRSWNHYMTVLRKIETDIFTEEETSETLQRAGCKFIEIDNDYLWGINDKLYSYTSNMERVRISNIRGSTLFDKIIERDIKLKKLKINESN